MQRLETPPVFARLERGVPGHGVRRRCRRRLIARIGCALIHPRHKIRDDGIRELGAILRHLGIRILVADALDEQALLRVAGKERRPGIAALAQSVTEIHAQPAFLLRRPVTFVALVDQRRPDALLEEFKLARRDRGRRLNGEAG